MNCRNGQCEHEWCHWARILRLNNNGSLFIKNIHIHICKIWNIALMIRKQIYFCEWLNWRQVIIASDSCSMEMGLHWAKWSKLLISIKLQISIFKQFSILRTCSRFHDFNQYKRSQPTLQYIIVSQIVVSCWYPSNEQENMKDKSVRGLTNPTYPECWNDKRTYV